jgi:hypothetical protein
MIDILANLTLAGFLSILLIFIIRDFARDTKNSSRSVEDATPQTQTKENK